MIVSRLRALFLLLSLLSLLLLFLPCRVPRFVFVPRFACSAHSGRHGQCRSGPDVPARTARPPCLSRETEGRRRATNRFRRDRGGPKNADRKFFCVSGYRGRSCSDSKCIVRGLCPIAARPRFGLRVKTGGWRPRTGIGRMTRIPDETSRRERTVNSSNSATIVLVYRV